MAFIVKVKYQGYWVDCCYEGGREINIPLSHQDMSIYNLRYYISQYCSLVCSDFAVFYLKTTENGRIVKSLLRTDNEVVELFNNVYTPTVYVGSTDGASSSHVGASSSTAPFFDQPQPYYVPLFDQSQPYGGSSYNHGTNWEDQQLTTFAASTNWMEDLHMGENNSRGVPFHLSSNVQEHTFPDLNQTLEVDIAQTDERPPSDGDEDDEDGDYIASDTPESEGQSNLYNGGRQMNRVLFAEWTAWIQEEGGMQKLLGIMYPDLHGAETEADTDTDHMSNWIVPIIPPRPRDSAVFNDDDLNIDELGVHSIFWSKSEIWITVGLWHLQRRKEYKVVKSDGRIILMTCKLSEECPFRLLVISEGGPWTVSIFCEEHTCSEFGLTHIHYRKVKSIVIGTLFAKRLLRDAEILKPKIIKNELLSEYGVHASYDACLKGRNAAIEMVYGKHKDSFNDLLGYLHMLKLKNPRTVTNHEISSDGRFKHVFIALGQSILAYCNGHIRPVIVVDGTHLKGKNHGVMFVAVAKDANEQLFPLAYGIRPVEDHDSWTWFMQCLKDAYGTLRGHLIVSDQHASIIHAVKGVFPDTFHGFCYYHLAKKLVAYGKNVGEQFQHAAYTYSKTEHEKIMKGIRSTSRLAYNKVIEIGPEKWSRSQCPARRYSNMTSNAAESFNNSLLWARRLPICACLDAVRLIIEEWFNERREKCQNDREPITEEARRKMVVQLERADTYRATKISNLPHYKVKTSQREVKVDLQRHMCECER